MSFDIIKFQRFFRTIEI